MEGFIDRRSALLTAMMSYSEQQFIKSLRRDPAHRSIQVRSWISDLEKKLNVKVSTIFIRHSRNLSYATRKESDGNHATFGVLQILLFVPFHSDGLD